MSTLRNLVFASAAGPDELPLIHTSLSEHLPSFATTGHIQPQPCKVFGSSLVYLFYGRPSYRSNRGSAYGDSIALCPVCFVFKPRSVSKTITHIHPCDTGGAHRGMFAPEILAKDLPELALHPTIESARKAVSLLFETNSKYFFGKVIMGKTFVANSVEDRFYQLLLKKGPVGYDDRKSAIEVTVSQPITLADQLLFVVLPRAFLEDEATRDAILNQWNCDPVCYDTIDGDKPDSYYSVVRNEVSKRFRDATRI